MKASVVLASLAAAAPALATDLAGYTTNQCSGGPYSKCTNIGPRVCCNLIVGSGSNLHGAASGLFSGLPTHSSITTWQTSPSAVCGTAVGNYATPNGGSVCTTYSFGGGSQYSGLSWVANNSKKRRGGEPEIQRCTSSVPADTFVLADGSEFDLLNMTTAEKDLLVSVANAGATEESIPKELVKFAKGTKAAPMQGFTTL